MEMWISTYALTGGVQKHDGEVINTGTFYAPRYGYYRIGKDAHATEEAANAAAESMRVKKIASLRKQIVKLEGMKF